MFVSSQCKEGGFPHDLWLSVSAENVSVYKRGEPKPLETFPYEHIIFFGAPQPCTYKITVDEREMFFETPQVPHCTHFIELKDKPSVIQTQTNLSKIIKTVAECFSWCAFCLNLLNRLCMHVHALASLPFFTVCFVCTLSGRRDHKDHESLHKHDREEALQCEVSVQLWNQLDQVIDLTGHQNVLSHSPSDEKRANAQTRCREMVKRLQRRLCFRAFREATQKMFIQMDSFP